MEGMEYIAEVASSSADADAFLENCSLSPSVMLDQIVEGKITETPPLTHARHCNARDNFSDKASSPALRMECSMKNRLQSADSGMVSNFCHNTETDGSSPFSRTNSNLFEKYCETLPDRPRTKVKLMVTKCNKSDGNMLECHESQGSANYNSDHIGLAVNDAVVDQNHCLSKSIVHGLEVADQDHCISQSIEQFDYIGLEVACQDHCLTKPAGHAIDQNHCISKSTEQFQYVGLEVAYQDHCLTKSAGHTIDQDHCVSKSTEQFHYVGLEVFHQDHCLTKLVGHVGDQDHYISKSTEQFDYVGLDVLDQDECFPISTEKHGNSSKLDVIGQDQCIHESTKTLFNSGNEMINQGCHGPSLTEKDNNISDQYCCVPRSMQTFNDYVRLPMFDQNSETCFQGRHQMSLDSNSGQYVKSNDKAVYKSQDCCLQFNNDGYIISPALTGQCSHNELLSPTS